MSVKNKYAVEALTCTAVAIEKLAGRMARPQRVLAIVLLPLMGLACFALFFVALGVAVANSRYVDYGKAAWTTVIIVATVFASAGAILFAAWFNLMCSSEEQRATQEMTR